MYHREPTVIGVPKFNADEDAAALSAELTGSSSDDEEIVMEILCSRSNAQRQEISRAYMHKYGRDLYEDLQWEMGRFSGDLIDALMTPPEEYLCREIYKCIEDKSPQDVGPLVEILCTRTKQEIAAIVEAYERCLLHYSLAEHIDSGIYGSCDRILTLIVTEPRDEEAGTDAARAQDAAQQLFDAGEAKWGTDDDEIFNKILAHESFGQLRLIFECYKELAGRTIEQAIKAEIGGKLKEVYCEIVEIVQNAPAWFARRLHNTLRGSRAVDRTLIRVMVSRSEIDLGNIKKEYERIYDKTLESAIKREPTVVGVPNFNAAEDAAALRAAMKGFGTDEEAIIDILCTRSNAQRQEISRAFTHEYGRDLIDDLKSELGGHFEDVIVALMLPPEEYLCKELHHCMEGLGTDEGTLVEILCTRTKKEIAAIVDAYERLYNRPLAEHMCSETSGDFRRLLTLIVTSGHKGARDEEAGTDAARAQDAAQQLFDAGEAKWGTDEEIFNKILAHESFGQLRLIFECYKELAGRTIEQAIKAEIGGELKEAYSAIVETVQNAPAWFAHRLRAAMQGLGTDDRTLIRVIVSRSEIDLGNIKQEYERIYDKTLESEVKQGETSGDYKRALVTLLGPA